jgi:hypothetical protein
MRRQITHSRVRRAALALALATSLAGAALAATSALAGSGSATIYFDRTSCLGTETGTSAGTVTYTRSGKVIEADVSLTGDWTDGAHGVLLFVLTPNGGCPASGQFLGTVTTSGGSGSNTFLAKIQGARADHDITLVLCVGQPGIHFSNSATLTS